eukprot:GEMP01083158.1.p1 GENE.GEMP01083158.1~~GEMP01083158.1.p1  ORF type:complete len:294 (+),score=79.62 GEMP01083158.1:97-978(+)
MSEFLFDESELLRTLREVVKFAAESPDDQLADKLETDLCALWDATADRHCTEFLFKNHLVASMEGSLQRLHDARAKEICWGILSNVASHSMGGFDDDVPFSLLALEASDATEVLQSLRFALATVCSKLIPVSYWAPLADKCLWCVENALLSTLALTAADLLSAIYQAGPKFHVVAPCATRALEFVRKGEHEDDQAAQALLRTVETGVLAENVNSEELRAVLETLLACLEGSLATQVATLDVLEIVDSIITHDQWPIAQWHKDQVMENDDATAEQKRLFGLADASGSPEVPEGS